LQLTLWNSAVFERRKIKYKVVNGLDIANDKDIATGQVLDAHRRVNFSLSQCMQIIQLMKNKEITNEDIIYFEDMFTPGIEGIFYVISQLSDRRFVPKIWVRCLAQTIDPDDFVNYTGMVKWMRYYEKMVTKMVTGVLASSGEM